MITHVAPTPGHTHVGAVRGLALLRQLPGLFVDPLGSIGAAIGQELGAVEYRFPGRSTFVVNDAALVQEVLTSSQRFVKPTLGARFTLWFGPEGLPGPRDFRGLAAAGFARQRVDPLVAQVDAAIRTLWPRLDFHAITETPIDVTWVAMRASVLASGWSLFRADLRSEASRLEGALDEIQRYYARQGPRVALGLPDVIRTPSSGRVRSAAGELRAVVSRVIDARPPDASDGDDLLGLLLHNCLEAGTVSQSMIENIVMSALLSSFETTGCALAWTLTLVAANPHHAAAIAGEADAIADASPSVQAIGRAAHTRAVIREALRLYPPSWIILREAGADTWLDDCLVPQGSTVMISPYWVHRDERRWPNPCAFEPARFGAASPAPEPGSYIPFGAGAHGCFGARFALLVAHTALLRLLERYEMHPVEDTLPGPEALISLRPDRPVLVNLSLRRAR